MADLIPFTPRSSVDAALNLEDFIRLAREGLTAFGGREGWESDRWQEGETVAVFGTKREPLTPYAFTPMADPFRDFAKAYLRYQYSLRPTVTVAYLIHALRCIEAALVKVYGRADIALLNGVVLDASAVLCREFFESADVWHKTGLQMKRICDFCRDHMLVPALPQWVSPFKKPVTLTASLSEEGRAHRENKLPSNATMLMVADLFAKADDVESRYFSSIMVLLMVAPNRISEVLNLPVDCIGWEEDDQGTRQMYLRWHAGKGMGDMKKWIVPSMHSVVEEAVRRLEEIGRPARAAARFVFDNPGRFLPHDGCTLDPRGNENVALTPNQFRAAMGSAEVHHAGTTDPHAGWKQLTQTAKWVQRLRARGPITYAALAEYVRSEYAGHAWPYIDPDGSVAAWDALCLCRENEFHQSRNPKPFSWVLPSANEVNVRMDNFKGMSLFERYDLRHSDGSSVSLTSHQLRHWLSTMCERAGMDDFTLAQWAGRARVADNRHYDHRSPQERAEQLKLLLRDEPPSLLERIRGRQPVTYQELGIDRLGTAKATLYGMCTHDFAMAPCMKQRECITCKDHVCIKGDHVSLERLKRLEEQTEALLRGAQEAHADGVFGADRWVDSHKWKLAHTKAMRVALENQALPDGALLRIPEGHDPSPVRRTLMELGLIEEGTSTQSGRSLIGANLKLPGAKNA